MCLIAPHMETYLQDYLPRQRGCSPHTIETYAFSFQLLFIFAASHLKVSPSAIHLQQLDAKMVTDFLNDLETNRGCAASTRNVRAQSNPSSTFSNSGSRPRWSKFAGFLPFLSKKPIPRWSLISIKKRAKLFSMLRISRREWGFVTTR